MNICLVSREFPPFFEGGIGSYTSRWSESLTKAGHHVVVLTISPASSREQSTVGNLTVIRSPAFRTSPPSRLNLTHDLDEIISHHAIDIIEFPDTGALGWAWMRARLSRNPHAEPTSPSLPRPAVVTHLHSPTRWVNEWNRVIDASPEGLILQRREADCIRWADAVVCPSHDLADWVSRDADIPRDRVDIIPLPLGELEAIIPTPRKPTTNRPLRVLFVGRLEPRKGIDLLLAAAVEAINRGAKLRIDVVGRDVLDPRTCRPFGARNLEFIDNRAVRAIHFHGPLPPSVVARLRAKADLIAVPSPMDNFPYVCVEAMASGVPVLAARAGGAREMIRDHTDGLLFEPGNIMSCAATLIEAAGMPRDKLHAMGASAATRIRELCAHAVVTPQRIDHYRRAIGFAATRTPIPVDVSATLPHPRVLGPILVARGALERPASVAHWRRAAVKANAELDAIHRSRGWRCLRMIYAALHRLRGRKGSP